MKNEVEVLILAGGKGERLAPIVSDVPKSMAPILGKPFLEYQIKWLHEQGFRRIHLLLGHKASIIQNYFTQNAKKLENPIKFSIEDRPLGTGGAIKQVMKKSSSSSFLVLNGDSFFLTDLSCLLKNRATVALKKVNQADRYGVVQVDQTGIITSFSEKKNHRGEALINGGIYFLPKEIATYFPPDDDFSLEKDFFPFLVHEQKLWGEELDGDFLDIGTPDDYALAPTFVEKHNLSPI